MFRNEQTKIKEEEKSSKFYMRMWLWLYASSMYVCASKMVHIEHIEHENTKYDYGI